MVKHCIAWQIRPNLRNLENKHTMKLWWAKNLISARTLPGGGR
jgi:hypothetical protein